MTISELITKLEEIRKTFGDLDIEVPKDGFGTASLTEVNVEVHRDTNRDLEYEYVELL